jgi:DNA-directed RNA polymerase beta' subunit
MAELYEVVGEERYPDIADAIKDIGFDMLPIRLFLAVSDNHPCRKAEIVNWPCEAETVSAISRGLLTEQEQNERGDRDLAAHNNQVADAVKRSMDATATWQPRQFPALPRAALVQSRS